MASFNKDNNSLTEIKRREFCIFWFYHYYGYIRNRFEGGEGTRVPSRFF